MLRLALVFLALQAALSAQGRVVLLGVDGLDHALTRTFMEAGDLPELARLAAEGSFGPLLPTNPAQSPVSWASLTTGLDPGGTGVFGFLRRGLRDGEVIPELALAEPVETEMFGTRFRIVVWTLLALTVAFLAWILRRHPRAAVPVAGLVLLVGGGALLWAGAAFPETVVVPRNLRSGEALWSGLDREGLETCSLWAPCAFPAPGLVRGRLLGGLGVPDLAGTMGQVAVFRDEPVPDGVRLTSMGGRDVQLRRVAGTGRLEGASILGPQSPLDGLRVELPVGLEKTREGLRVSLQEESLLLAPGEFSEFVPVVFRIGPVIALRGLVRFLLLRGGDRPVVYQEPVQIDPRSQPPLAPITSPVEFGEELAAGGLFETLGWATATNPYQDGLIDDATFLQDVRGIVARQHAMVLEALDRPDWRVFFCVLSTPDRVQHMFWRDRDPDHPAHDAEAAARRGDQIRESYRGVDRLVGRVRQRLAPDDALLVVSDHGFAPFRHAVNLNRWLAEEGYLVGRADGTRNLEEGLGKPVFRNLDWSRTRAYSLGLGRLWLNLRGREPLGIVPPEGADALLEELRQKLLGLRHEGRPVIRSVARADEIYSGARLAEASDLVVGFERGYRVSWNSCLGGLDEPLIFENRERWSGDHCSVDPALVPGVIFSSRPLVIEGAHVTDVYPTLRRILGLAPRTGLAGRALEDAPR